MSRATRTSLDPRRQPAGLAFVLALVATVFVIAPQTWFVAAFEGLLAIGVVASAFGWGAWFAAGLRVTGDCRLKRIAVASALGVGLLGLATLALGLGGALSQTVAWGLVGVGWLLGLLWLALDPAWREAHRNTYQATGNHPQTGSAAGQRSRTQRFAELVGGLALGVTAGVAVCGASLPPGILWDEEGKGYDALIYHLQCPREYYNAGRIHFLPHNVYASFPQQVESLYLLTMHLAGGSLEGAIPSQWIHLLLGVLAVVAIAAWSPPGIGRWSATLLAGSAPWLAYVGCLAYVELGTLLFAAVAGGLVVDALSTVAAKAAVARGAGRMLFVAGLCAGLASGTKYTALGFVVGALGVAWLVSASGWRWRVRGGLVFAAGVLLAFAPWLVRNEAFTANPVYPFGYRWFGGAAWSAEQDAQWSRGHRVPDALGGSAGRVRAIWNEALASPMFAPTLVSGSVRIGLLPALLLVFGALTIRTRAGAILCVWLALIVVIWAGATHMPGRFVTIAVAPFALLTGLAVGRARRASGVAAIIAVVIAGLNVATLVNVWRSHDRAWRARGVELGSLVGRVDVMRDVQIVNQLVPETACVWQVGDARAFYLRPRVHYTVVFNRDPWLTFAEHAAPADAIVWLRSQGVSHVVFSWAEIDRLRGTYGFPEWVSRAWVAALESAGLHRLDGSDAAVEVFEIGAR